MLAIDYGLQTTDFGTVDADRQPLSDITGGTTMTNMATTDERPAG